MEVIYGRNNNAVVERPSGVGLGNFDGLHVGHMALINTLIDQSGFYGLNSVLYTFTKHPENIIRKKLFTPLLTTEGKKIELLGRTQLGCLFFDEFDESFSRMSPETFVSTILVGKLKAKLAVAGFDYRFGYRGQGDVGLLKKLGDKYGFKVVIIPPIKIDNEIVSSTLIREFVARGDMDRVFKFLGRHHSITGEVSSGRKIGSKIGFPTANIHPEDYLIMPHSGVYITKTLLGGILYPSVTNIGNNPTFGNQDRVSIETHILDFEKDIFRTKIEVFFISKIRNERKFKGTEELAEQIRNDISAARRYFGL